LPVDTPTWVQDAVFYQIFPDRFARSGRVAPPGPLESWESPPTPHGFKGGDLFGVADGLDDLRSLGVTALYLNPVFTSASNHRYHTDDYMAVDPLLGGEPALRELLDRAHALEMRVVLDGVFNHSGRGFWPFHHVLENGPQSPYHGWFFLDPAVLRGERGLDAFPSRDPGIDMSGATDRIGYRAWWGNPALPKLDVAHPHVREYLFSVAEHWLDFGIDGWRLDVPTEIEEPTFWAEFRRRCRAIKPDAYLVGEIWTEAPDWLAGDRFDALMNYPLGAAILGFAAGTSLDTRVVAEHHVYRHTIRRLDGAAFGHEVERLMAIYAPEIVASQLNLIGSHDAPRALTVMGGDAAALRLAFTLLLTLPGAPCVYYGDEIGLAGHHDPDCRRSMPRRPGAGDQSLRQHVATLTAARHATIALRRGTVRTVGGAGDAVVLLREADGERALVAINPGRAPQVVRLEALGSADPAAWASVTDLVSPGAELVRGSDPGEPMQVTLPPQSAAVVVAR
jgi:neopullulanase